jgi:hypothetical protein
MNFLVIHQYKNGLKHSIIGQTEEIDDINSLINDLHWQYNQTCIKDSN